VNGKAETRRDREALRCIIALLLSLAGLAERAAERSFFIRFLVLSGLRHAHHVARDCFVGPSCTADITYGHEPADAIGLAASFRALALVVGNIAALTGLRGGLPCRTHAGICALGTVYFLPADGRCRFKRGAGGKK